MGGILAAIFQIGGVFSIVAGHIGDRLQERNLSGRAIVSTVGILGGIPFFLVFFFIPLRGLDVTDGRLATGTLLGEVLTSLVTNPWVAAAFLTSSARSCLLRCRLPQLVRPDLGRQSSRASRHRLRCRQSSPTRLAEPLGGGSLWTLPVLSRTRYRRP